MKKIKIIGGGVSGLTVGVHLLQAGYEVSILTEKKAAESTSAKAAAIWFPYEVGPQDKANAWSKTSFEVFASFCGIPEAGVSMIPMRVLIQSEEEAWWKAAIPNWAIRKANKEELPGDHQLGYMVQAPLVETPVYLRFLTERFLQLGGQLILAKVQDLHDLLEENTMLINCTGLAARQLVKDEALYPIQGQIVRAQRQVDISCTLAEFSFGQNGELLAYVIPRKDCLVLGGTAVKHAEDIVPLEKTTQGIIDRCQEVEPHLNAVEILSVEVGLRPGRPEIRLEREGNIIHNYGHGGGGFTVSWGCAEEVKQLIEQWPKLVGSRIMLRDWIAEDLPIYRNWNIGHYPWMDFNGPYFPKKTPEEIDQQIARISQRIADADWPSPRKRLVIANLETNKILGTVNWYWESEATNWKSIGIVLHDDQQWGKGLGFEALSLWIDYLFAEDEKLVRLDLRTWSGNTGMIRLAEKLGFIEEARFRKARVLNGKYYDSIGMGILREEWKNESSF